MSSEFTYWQRKNTKEYEEGYDRIFKKSKCAECGKKLVGYEKEFCTDCMDYYTEKGVVHLLGNSRHNKQK